MNTYSCINCSKEFKFKSYYTRHIESKKGCKKNTINTINTLSTINEKDNEISTNTNDIKKSILKLVETLKKDNKSQKVLELLLEVLHTENKLNIDNKIENIDEIDNIDILCIDKSYTCNFCNMKFKFRQGKYKHIKNGKCKYEINTEFNIANDNKNIKEQDEQEEDITSNDYSPEKLKIKDKYKKGFILNDIIDSSIDNTINNITNNTNSNNNNNNNITNNITNNSNNNIIININPFGCESLEHITTKDFKSIFNNYEKLNIILFQLSNLVYIDNINNMNFTKNNLNKNIVTYLSSNMEYKTLPERQFLKEYENNIKTLCIELFHIHKNKLTVTEMISYMTNYLEYINIVNNKKKQNIELQDQIKSIMDCIFRNEEVKLILKKLEANLLLNPEIKQTYLQKNNFRQEQQKQRLDEYNKEPNINNIDDSNLYKIKKKAIKNNNKPSIKHINKIIDKQSDRINNEYKKEYNISYEKLTGIIDDRY